MQKIKDFESFAAALSFYACNDPYVMAQQSSDAKFEAVAKNIRKLIRD